MLQSRDKAETKVMIPYSTHNIAVMEGTIFSEAGRHYMTYDPVQRSLEIR
jgi:hypothetical protein